MQARLIDGVGAARTFVLVFDSGDEPVAALRRWADEAGVSGASFTGIGAFSRATLGYFDVEARDYERIPVEEQVEVLALSGNIALHEGSAKIHAHVVVGTRGGHARGGHLLGASVRPTLELVVVESAASLRRRHDPATGLALLDVSA